MDVCNTNVPAKDQAHSKPCCFSPDCVVGGAADHVLPFVLQAGNPSAVTVKGADKLTCGGSPHLVRQGKDRQVENAMGQVQQRMVSSFVEKDQ